MLSPRAEIQTNPGCPPNSPYELFEPSSHQPPVESAEICAIGGSAPSRPAARARHHQALRNKPTAPSKARHPFPAHQKITKRTQRPQACPVPNPRPSLPGPRQKTRNTKQTHPARATPLRLNRSKVSRNTKHETRAKASHQRRKYFSPNPDNNLAPHHPRTTPKNLTPHATLQPRPVRIVHPINSPRLARTVEVALAVRTPPRTRFKA